MPFSLAYLNSEVNLRHQHSTYARDQNFWYSFSGDELVQSCKRISVARTVTQLIVTGNFYFSFAILFLWAILVDIKLDVQSPIAILPVFTPLRGVGD
jgi:hypothetical protein